jgi:hypothetical protein
MTPGTPTPSDVWAALHAVRRTGPLVHNLTNYVAMDLSANVLLAAGASPAMVHAREEADRVVGLELGADEAVDVTRLPAMGVGV